MDVVVFGAAGFVGRNLLSRLGETEHHVTACDVVPIDGLAEEVAYRGVDITDEQAVMEVVEGADAVVHLAAHQLPESTDEPKRNAEVNVVGTLNVLEAVRRHDVAKIFFPSASSILGAYDGSSVPEDVRPDPRSPYGVAKHAVEEYLSVYAELYGIEYLVFRFFNVYGPHQRPDSGAFVPVVMSRLAAGDGVFVTGDGQQTRDFVYVRDVTDLIVEGIQREDVANEVVNMGYGESVTLLDAINIIARVVDVEPEIERRPEREDEIGNYCADMTKCRRLFGRKPETTFEAGVAATYEWMQTDPEITF